MAELVWVDAREQAENILKSYWKEHVFPVPVISISNSLGVEMFTAPLPDDLSGMIIQDGTGNSQARAYADSFESRERRRFTYAHELGHFIERNQVANDKKFSFEDHRDPKHYDLHEFYADEFAGALLMPQEDVKEQLKNGASIYEMAKRYGVSLPAIEKRLERLRKTNAIDD